uniref:Uncharacterized protein n=1 Tax=Trichinella nativa TaxID=6335 RepID=A0A0V1KJR3_9BILA
MAPKPRGRAYDIDVPFIREVPTNSEIYLCLQNAGIKGIIHQAHPTTHP